MCLSEVKGIDIKDEKKIKKEKNFTHDVSKSRDNDMHNTNSGRNKCSGSNNLWGRRLYLAVGKLSKRTGKTHRSGAKSQQSPEPVSP